MQEVLEIHHHLLMQLQIKCFRTSNDTFYPTISSGDPIDHSLSEIAKTFHFREFGNGSANGGTGASWADASMLYTTSDDIGYCMDDGLTSLQWDNVKIASDIYSVI